MPYFPTSLITLNEFIIHDGKLYPEASGTLGSLLRDIALTAKRIHIQVNKAGLADELRGATGMTNIQGEKVQKLDSFANQLMIQTLSHSLDCAGISSEEEKENIIFNTPHNNQSKYIVHFDPIDGSDNIDVSAALGTTFSVYRRKSPRGEKAIQEDFLQSGSAIIAAGYILYGSSTILVYATERGCNGFTLDTSMGEFCLSHKNMTIPKEGNILSINTGNYYSYPVKIQQYIKDTQSSHKGEITLRYIGTMVADIHRNLIKGGIFLYPPTDTKPKGKLRLLYECNPMAYVIEKAGGVAINEKGKRILDIHPTDIHERTPFYIGSQTMVEKLQAYL